MRVDLRRAPPTSTNMELEGDTTRTAKEMEAAFAKALSSKTFFKRLSLVSIIFFALSVIANGVMCFIVIDNSKQTEVHSGVMMAKQGGDIVSTAEATAFGGLMDVLNLQGHQFDHLEHIVFEMDVPFKFNTSIKTVVRNYKIAGYVLAGANPKDGVILETTKGDELYFNRTGAWVYTPDGKVHQFASTEEDAVENRRSLGKGKKKRGKGHCMMKIPGKMLQLVTDVNRLSLNNTTISSLNGAMNRIFSLNKEMPTNAFLKSDTNGMVSTNGLYYASGNGFMDACLSDRNFAVTPVKNAVSAGMFQQKAPVERM